MIGCDNAILRVVLATVQDRRPDRARRRDRVLPGIPRDDLRRVARLDARPASRARTGRAAGAATGGPAGGFCALCSRIRMANSSR